MLVLTRRPKESIKIGDNITITVVRLKGEAVSIGIEAPKQIRVLRSELAPKDSPADVVVEEPTGSDEAQVIQFRFTPEVDAVVNDRPKFRRSDRGPLANLMSLMQAPGCISEATSP